MRRTVEGLKRVGLVFCFALAVNAVTAAQQTPHHAAAAPAAASQLTAAEALSRYEQLLKAATDASQKFYLTNKIVPTALAADEKEKAKTYALSLLEQAASMRNNWNYGNAVHIGNIVLGQLALDAGDVAEARRLLLEAGKTPGSPQLNSFGPNMMLAKELLSKGEKETVIEYLNLCAKFWLMHNGKLDIWKAAAAKGETPDFGPSLNAHLTLWRFENWDKLKT
ncbi:MAG TPA: hypothetical protein VGV59_15830 [Pyrinomonadaceae bacterium]|nr:hypothetical protein [Pyrinomonadaceae bacterium]